MKMFVKEFSSMGLLQYVCTFLLTATTFALCDATLFNDPKSCENFCRMIPKERGSEEKMYPKYSRYMAKGNKCRCYLNDAITYDVYNGNGESLTGGPGLSDGIIRSRLKTLPITNGQQCNHFCKDIPIEPGLTIPKYPTKWYFKIISSGGTRCLCYHSNGMTFDEYRTMVDGTIEKYYTDLESQQKIKETFFRYRDDSIDALKEDHLTHLTSGQLNIHQSPKQSNSYNMFGHSYDHQRFKQKTDSQETLDSNENLPSEHQEIHNNGESLTGRPRLSIRIPMTMKPINGQQQCNNFCKDIPIQSGSTVPKYPKTSRYKRRLNDETRCLCFLADDRNFDEYKMKTDGTIYYKDLEPMQSIWKTFVKYRDESIEALKEDHLTSGQLNIHQTPGQFTSYKSSGSSTDHQRFEHPTDSKKTLESTDNGQEALASMENKPSGHHEIHRSGHVMTNGRSAVSDDKSPLLRKNAFYDPPLRKTTPNKEVQYGINLKSFPIQPSSITCDTYCKENRYLRGEFNGPSSCQCFFGPDKFSLYTEGTFRYSNVTPKNKPGNSNLVTSNTNSGK